MCIRDSLKGYSGEVVLVGVNYVSGKEENGEFKKHECRIERDVYKRQHMDSFWQKIMKKEFICL